MRKRIISAIGLTLLLASVTGCQYFAFPGVYKIDIQQGNIITQEMVDQLKPGMTKRQVRFVMGNPLVEDTFHPDRWDYVYTMRPGKGEASEHHLTVFFEDDKLVSMTGDFAPGQAPAAATSGSAS